MSADDLRAAILADDDRPREAVDVPWPTNGEKVYARAMSIGAWSKYLVGDGEVKVTGDMMAGIVCESLVDEDGRRIFKGSDASRLLEKNAETVMAICAVVMRLSKLDGSSEVDFASAQPSEASSG